MKKYVEREDEDEDETEASLYTNYCAAAIYSNYFENGRNNCQEIGKILFGKGEERLPFH
jgi:hypothetical protein